MMTELEKKKMVYCLLRDIRLNWADEVNSRVRKAQDLCAELVASGNSEFATLSERCDRFLAEDPNWIDGRFFRRPFPEGYERMGLNVDVADCGDEFRDMFDEYITCPTWFS